MTKSQLKRIPQFKRNLRSARQLWPDQMSDRQVNSLRTLSIRYSLSIDAGDLQNLDGRWYITHAGLVRLAERRHCIGIQVQQIPQFCDSTANHWVFRATVFKSKKSKGFVGFGDADPSNVSPLVRGAEMRVAETRAVNRALRKAYGIGLCSVEELGWSSKPAETGHSNQARPFNAGSNSHHNGQTRLRDQLCVLIRQHNLDPNLVKAYAAHFCGTQTVKEASRELVESFISHLAASAKEDRDGLICKLNSFAPHPEVQQ